MEKLLFKTMHCFIIPVSTLVTCFVLIIARIVSCSSGTDPVQLVSYICYQQSGDRLSSGQGEHKSIEISFHWSIEPVEQTGELLLPFFPDATVLHTNVVTRIPVISGSFRYLCSEILQKA